MRKIWDIPGGIHPDENKSQSLQTPIQHAGIPDVIILPLAMHIGAPATPIVNVGDFVLKGQQIAKANGFVSVPIHASTSGEVIAIEAREIAHPSGMRGPCIIIKPDGKDTWSEIQGINDYTELSKADLVNLIREAGIAGMGGAGFPSAVKLNTRDDQPIETLIINGTECEPYITADDILMRERADQIIAGVKILQHIIKPSVATVIGVEDNKPEGIQALQEAAEGTDIEIASFPTKYPSGGEKQLIQILTGKEVPAGGLPSAIGIVLQNIGTAVAIYRAVRFGEPLIQRITTVTGNAVAQQQNFEVLIGTPTQHLLNRAGFSSDDCSRLINGGPMMGFALESAEVPIVKTTNCILAPDYQEMPAPTPAQACIRCGMCAEACPVSLLPQQMYWYAQSKNLEALEDHNIADCIECGACSYSCPSHIPLVQYYRASKNLIKVRDLEHEKSEQAKQRFEAKQARVEAEEREKEEKRLARQAKAKAAAAKKATEGETSEDPVQAALDRAKAKKAGTESADPVQAAIERAKAKRSGDDSQSPLEKAQAQVDKLTKRIEGSQVKLEKAQAEGADTIDAFKAGLEKQQAQLNKAQEELAKLQTEKTAKATDKVNPVADEDPAAQAIAKAMAKRSGNAPQLSEEEKLNKDIASIEKRIKTAEGKLETADDSTREILQQSISQQQDKLNAAKQALNALTPEKIEDTSSPVDEDPAAQAIARAMAKRTANANVSPEEKRAKDIDATTKRIASTEEKLAAAQAEGDDEKAEILSNSIAKMKDKLTTLSAE